LQHLPVLLDTPIPQAPGKSRKFGDVHKSDRYCGAMAPAVLLNFLNSVAESVTVIQYFPADVTGR
jgi:hypothetical protein